MRHLHSGTAFAGSIFPAGAAPAAEEAGREQEKREWTISEMARDFSVTLRTLRFYEARGLISPQRFGGARYYSGRDRARLALILNAKKMGFTLSETATMLGRDSDDTGLELSQGTVETQIAYLENQRAAIETALETLRKRQLELQATAA